MSTGVRALYGLALVCTLVGSAVVLLSLSTLSLGALSEHGALVARTAFSGGYWLLLLQVLGFVSAATLVVSLGGRALGLAQQQKEPGFSQFLSLGTGAGVKEAQHRIETCLSGDSPNIVAAFSELIRGALAVQASDIHLSPSSAGLNMTYRVHGTLHQVTTAPPLLAPRVVARAKVLARLNTHVHGTPQDGRLVMYLDGMSIDARVSSLPTESGERLVLRLVRGSRRVPELETLGFSEEVQQGLSEVLLRPQGLLFVTGPVGSGKTTTLYAALEHIVSTRGRTTTVVTLEDPVELDLPFATQTQMHPRAGMTFATTLRSVLRQDPNVLMVGEIRDRETADIAVQAGLTGHLILTTVHAESAAAPFARLGELQVEPFVLASATLGSLSQRLVRTLCTACRREAPPEAMVKDRVARHGLSLPAGRYYEPVGCDLCENQGFTGRVPIAELLVMGPELRKAVHDRADTNALQELARARGMTTLLQDGLQRASCGETPLAEVLRVAG